MEGKTQQVSRQSGGSGKNENEREREGVKERERYGQDGQLETE